MIKSMARWFLVSCLIPWSSWLLAAVHRRLHRFVDGGRLILARIFLREDHPAWSLDMKRPARSIRYLKHLGRLRRREGTLAIDLGTLAVAVHRQGLREHAKRFARGAFDHWCRARKAEGRLHRRVDEALKERAL